MGVGVIPAPQCALSEVLFKIAVKLPHGNFFRFREFTVVKHLLHSFFYEGRRVRAGL